MATMISEHTNFESLIESPTQSTPPTTSFSSGPLIDPMYIKTLSQGKFPIFLIMLPHNSQLYAMKVFDYRENKISNYFLNEIRFFMMSHRNVICIQYYNGLVEANLAGDNESINVSYLLMEYAPYGDLFDAIITNNIPFDEILTRTYFQQLINGLEYLHSLGIAHLDIKPENLLLGENFQLKLCDFDLSYINGDSYIKSLGTKDYRAPELKEKRCQDVSAADIFSAGIILFFMMTGGELPLQEGELTEDHDLYDLLQNNTRKFWRYFCTSRGLKQTFFNKDFKELFSAMLDFDPKKRPTIQEIKKSKWYNGRIYSQEELSRIMSSHCSAFQQ